MLKILSVDYISIYLSIFASTNKNNRFMERLAIIDHVSHTLYIEDVSDEDLEKYKGEEEDYIKENYTFEGVYSWDWIVDGEYFPTDDKTPYNLNEVIDNIKD